MTGRTPTLTQAAREFGRHLSPWLLGAALLAVVTARLIVGDWRITDTSTTPESAAGGHEPGAPALTRTYESPGARVPPMGLRGPTGRPDPVAPDGH